MTQNEFKVISQQIVAQVGKEAKKLEGDKHRLAAALKKSEETCAKVSPYLYKLCIAMYTVDSIDYHIFLKLSEELSSLRVDYEALLTKHELTVSEQEKQLKKTHTALQETEHVCHERVKIIDQLETTNAELVRKITILVIIVANCVST